MSPSTTATAALPRGESLVGRVVWPAEDSFPADPTGVRAARAWTRRVLDQWLVSGEAASDAVLIVSELATNAVRHGASPYVLRLEPASDGVLVEMLDGDPGRGEVRSEDPTASGGRGLALVQALSARWGVESCGLGKRTWCVVPHAATAR